MKIFCALSLQKRYMRRTLTHGEKSTWSMNPIFNIYGTTLINLPEWKPTEAVRFRHCSLKIKGRVNLGQDAKTQPSSSM